MAGDVADEETRRRPGPDGWESWRMVLACFTTTFLLGGVTRSSAVLYVAVMETFNVTRGEAAWPISLVSGFTNFAGILSGLLSTKLGLRTTCVIGGCMSFICLFLCFFANGIPYLTISFGILNAIGMGLMYNTNPVILSHYFRQYKGLALGINYCGSTVAAMVFPKLMELLYKTYGLRGLFLIYAGVMLNTPVVSYLMREPSWTRMRSVTTVAFSQPEPVKLRTQNCEHAFAVEEQQSSPSTSIVAGAVTPENGVVDLVPTKNGTDPTDGLRSTTAHLSDVDVQEDIAESTAPRRKEPIRSISAVIEARQVVESATYEPKLSLNEIFCNPLFYLLIASYLVFATYTDILFTVMVDLLCDKGLLQSTAIAIIPLVSITDMAGRIILPYIADRGFVNRKVAYAINFLSLGALTLILPSMAGLYLLTALFLTIGWFYGSTVVMCTVMASDLLGDHNLAVANGFICSTVGFIVFARPAFIGFFRDTIGSYDPMLYFWGICCISIGLAWSIVLLVLKRNKKD